MREKRKVVPCRFPCLNRLFPEQGRLFGAATCREAKYTGCRPVKGRGEQGGAVVRGGGRGGLVESGD